MSIQQRVQQVLKLYENNIPPEVISRLTNMPQTEVDTIIKHHKHHTYERRN